MDPSVFNRIAKYDSRIIVIKSRGEDTWRAAVEYYIQHSGGESNVQEFAIGYDSPEEAVEECERKLNERIRGSRADNNI